MALAVTPVKTQNLSWIVRKVASSLVFLDHFGKLAFRSLLPVLLCHNAVRTLCRTQQHPLRLSCTWSGTQHHLRISLFDIEKTDCMESQSLQG